MRRATLTVALVAAVAAPGADAKPKVRSITLAWGGDVVPGSHGRLPAAQGRLELRGVRPILRAADLAAVNVEGTLSYGGGSKCGGGNGGNCFAFQAPPSHVATFTSAGVDVGNLANNHANDYGRASLLQTAATLQRAGIAVTGRPGEITVVRTHGVRVAFLGFAPYPWASPIRNLAETRRLVGAARQRAEIVVVLMHAGAEGAGAIHVPYGEEIAFGEHRGRTRDFAHAAVDAGASVVLGSGPHVLRGIESYRGRLIAYSLANLAGTRNLGSAGLLGLSGILSLRLRPDGRVAGGRLYGLRIGAFERPQPDGSGASIRLVRWLSISDFGKRHWPMGPDGRLAPTRLASQGQ
jgi:hypothetical protein